jgi:hypothetical protein
MRTHDEPTLGWTVVLRRQPVHLREGRPEGGTSGFSMGSGDLPRSPSMGDVGDAKCGEPGQWPRR